MLLHLGSFILLHKIRYLVTEVSFVVYIKKSYFILTRMPRMLTRMARMARMLTRMTRWLA